MRWVLAGLLLLASLASSGSAADNPVVERLAVCHDSWLEWKDDPVRIERLATAIRASFEEGEGRSSLVPKGRQTVFGLPVTRLYPGSVGTGVGFSVMVAADFETTKAVIERDLGRSFKTCESGEGMRGCELGISAKRTVLLLAGEDPKSRTTVFGCFYYYEK